MVRAWFMDNSETDQRLEHHRNPPEFLNLDQLFKITGVEYFKLNPDTYLTDGALDKIKTDRGYTYEDEITCAEASMENYEAKLKSFYTEHLHTNEEIRYIIDGSGYFDVRDGTDRWIRIEVVAGDMIIIPSGIYHRFTLDVNNYIKVRRFFIGDPEWLPHNRPADEMECRQDYLKKLNGGVKNVLAQ